MLARRLRLVAAAAFAVPAAFQACGVPQGRLAAAPADAPAWKDIVTEKDVEAIARLTIADLKAKTMKSPGTFNSSVKKAIVGGYALAAIGNAGAAVGEGEAAKQKAAALRDGGRALAKAAKAKKFPEAKAAFGVVEKFPGGIAPAASGEPKKWKEVIHLEAVMENVTRVNDELLAALKKEDEFKKAGKDLAVRQKFQAVLARIAREERTEADWQGWCDDMTKAAGEISTAAAGKQYAAAKAANDRLQKSCTKCHDVYHKGKD